MILAPTYYLGGKCDPCLTPGEPPLVLPPPAAGGEWPPPPVSAIQIWYYLIQNHLTNGVPDGGSVLVGIGAEISTSTVNSGFQWSFGPDPMTTPGWGAPYIQVGIDYFDGAGSNFVGTDTPGEIAAYTTLQDAQAVGQEFKTYYGTK